MTGPRRKKALDVIVERLEAERQAGQTLLSLSERSKSVVLTPYQERIVSAQGETELKQLDLSLEVQRVRQRDEARLVTGDRIGTVRLVHGNEHLDVIVEPKIGNAAFFRLVEFSFATIAFKDEAVAYESKGSAPAFLVDFIVGQIEQFLRSRHFRDYSLRTDPDSRRPKGHLNFAAYATRQLPKAKYDVLPCSYFDFSEDVFENQVIAAALFIAGRLAAGFPADLRQSISLRIAKARRYLPGVRVRRITSNELSTFRYDPRNAAFKPIHDLCRIVLFNTSVALLPQRRLSFMAFSLSMGQLFEAYIRRAFQVALGTRLVPSKSRLAFGITGIDGTLELDGLIKTAPPIVVECKYKVVESLASLNFDEGRIHNADIYQCVAYAMHSDINAKEVLLFYPSAIPDGAPVQLAATIRSFQRSSGVTIPIKVVLLNLGVVPSRVVEALRERFHLDVSIAG